MVMPCRQMPFSCVSSDEDLVRRARAGNVRATELLLAKYRSLVESKARNYFLLGADHDDVVQEGMIGLYKAIRDFRDDRLSRFRAFADLCITRQIVTAVKTATRQKHLPLNVSIPLHQPPSSDPDSDLTLIDSLPDPHSADPQASLFKQFEAEGRLEAIRRMLSSLECVVFDCYLQGKTYREMSNELNCRPKAVDNALQRVKRKITETYQPD